MSEIGDRLLKAIDFAGISPAELARISGVSPPRIHEIATGKTKNPQGQTISKLSHALQIRTDWLMTGEGEMRQPIVAENLTCYDPKEQPYIAKVAAMMAEMDIDTQKDICLSVEKEKLLRDLLRQKNSDKKAG